MQVTHESILKLISYRWQLGYLNRRHRYATNIGRSLDFAHPDREPPTLPDPTAIAGTPCTPVAPGAKAERPKPHDMAKLESSGVVERYGYKVLKPSFDQLFRQPDSVRRALRESTPAQMNGSSRRRRVFTYLAVFAVGAAVGAVGLVAGAGGLIQTSTSGGTPIVSVRPTGVGLPLVGASGTVGAGDYASALKSYHDSGAYAKDLRSVDSRARSYMLDRVRELRSHPCQDTGGMGSKRACPSFKPALVLDIDETSLSNYANIAASNFTNTVGALAVGVARADDPAIRPTLRLFDAARQEPHRRLLHHRPSRQHPRRPLPDAGQPEERRLRRLGGAVAQPGRPRDRPLQERRAGQDRAPRATGSSPTSATRRATSRAATPTAPSSSRTPSTSSGPRCLSLRRRAPRRRSRPDERPAGSRRSRCWCGGCIR